MPSSSIVLRFRGRFLKKKEMEPLIIGNGTRKEIWQETLRHDQYVYHLYLFMLCNGLK